MLAGGTSLACCHVPLDIGNDHVDVDYQLSLKLGWGVSESGIEGTERKLNI